MASVPTADGGFDLGKFLQTVLGAGSSIYNATQSGNNAQTVANVSDPFASQRPYYQGQLKDTLGHQTNPYGDQFQTAYAGQTNPYTSQYQSQLNNQHDPYAAMIMQTIGKQSNPYQDQLMGLLTDPNSFKTDPGYQFALSQGQKGIERASNALYGTARAGALIPELAKYTEGYAAQNYDNRINQLAGLTGQQNTYNTNALNTLGNLSGQRQTTNTNQLGQTANLINGQNQYNLGNLGVLSNMYGTTGNINNANIGQLLTASGATSGSPAAAGAALQSGQQGTAASIGAALNAIPGLASFVPQIMQLIGGGGGGINYGNYATGPGAPQIGGPGGGDTGGPAPSTSYPAPELGTPYSAVAPWNGYEGGGGDDIIPNPDDWSGWLNGGFGG